MSSIQSSSPSIDQSDMPQWKMDLIQQRKKRLFGHVNGSVVSGCNDVNTGKCFFVWTKWVYIRFERIFQFTTAEFLKSECDNFFYVVCIC